GDPQRPGATCPPPVPPGALPARSRSPGAGARVRNDPRNAVSNTRCPMKQSVSLFWYNSKIPGRGAAHMRLPFHSASAALLLFVFGCHAPEDGAGIQNSSEFALEGTLDHAWTPDDDKLVAPIWLGDDNRGALVAPMYRGASDGIEDYVYAPPDGDCENARGVMRIDWNSKQNVVKYQLKYKKIPPHPSIHRTEGVDFFPNPAHLAPKDFDNGGYRFWTILAAQSFLNDFYYSATTLDFVGSQYDFPAGQPPGTIKVQNPVFGLLTNHLMFPEEDGSLFREWTMPYDKVEVEGGPWSLGIATYIPLTLCEGNEFQPISGQLRPWAGPWLTHDQLNMSWGDMLKRAPVFDTTVDENQAFPDFFG